MQDTKSQSTVIDLNLGAPGIPHSAVTFEIGPALFSRSVEIQTGSNGTDWQFAVQGYVSRTTDSERLTVEFPEQWDQYLRVQILDRDNAPLPVKKVSVEGVVRYLRFAAQPGRYWLYYGNEHAHWPAYDLTALASEPAPGEVTAGAEELNPEYTKPLSDRNPKLLYAILVLAILAMGYVTVRFLMKVKLSST